MRLRSGVGGLLLLSLFGCPILSLTDAEKQNASVCDASNACVDGWHCGSDGHCHENTSGGMCTDGDMMSCGVNAGECHAGTMTCSGGAFGACMGAVMPAAELCDNKDNDCNNMTDDGIADGGLCMLQQGVCHNARLRCVAGAFETSCLASDYGADFEPTTETLCDNKDNDCDGQTDEGLVQDCAKQLGVCMGAQVGCVNGSFPTCSDGVYGARSADYETFETKCDGLDNDCDGRVDAWAAQNVSQTPGKISRRPAAVSTASGDTLVLWEEEQTGGTFKVSARVVHRDGTMSAAVAPSASVTASTSSGLPAVAADGSTVFGVWSETTGTTHRLQMAPLDPVTGVSTLSMSNALQISPTAQPQELVIAVDASSSRVLTAWVEGSTLSVQEFAIGSLISIFASALTLSDVQNVQASVAGNNAFWLTFQTASTGQVQRCLVDPTAAKLVCTQLPQPTGLSPVIFPLNQSGQLFSASMFIRDVDAGSVQRVFSSLCDAGTCTVAAASGTSPYRVSMDHLRGVATARNQMPTFFAWQEQGSDYHFIVGGRGDGGVQPGPSSNPGRRPLPVFTGTNRGAVVFDTEGVTSGSIGADDVFVARYCL